MDLRVKEKVMSKRGKVKVAEKRILISVSERMHQDLKAAAMKKGVSASKFVRHALAQALGVTTASRAAQR